MRPAMQANVFKWLAELQATKFTLVLNLLGTTELVRHNGDRCPLGLLDWDSPHPSGFMASYMSGWSEEFCNIVIFWADNALASNRFDLPRAVASIVATLEAATGIYREDKDS